MQGPWRGGGAPANHELPNQACADTNSFIYRDSSLQGFWPLGNIIIGLFLNEDF